MTGHYRRYGKAWKLAHPKARQKDCKRYYDLTRDAPHRYERWAPADVARITAPDRPRDRELARLLGRGVLAIQLRRARVRAADRGARIGAA